MRFSATCEGTPKSEAFWGEEEQAENRRVEKRLRIERLCDDDVARSSVFLVIPRNSTLFIRTYLQ